MRLAFGPVGVVGWASLLLGILLRRRSLAPHGLAGVVAVNDRELGGFKTMNEASPPGVHPARPSRRVPVSPRP